MTALLEEMVINTFHFWTSAIQIRNTIPFYLVFIMLIYDKLLLLFTRICVSIIYDEFY